MTCKELVRRGGVLAAGLVGMITVLAALTGTASAERDAANDVRLRFVAPPQPAPVANRAASRVSPADAERTRLARINAAKSWGYQLDKVDLDKLAASPYDMLVLDATVAQGRYYSAEQIARLKRKPDGGTRLVISYVSVGEAEDYRPDYFTREYMEEDAPDWLMHENPEWKGNRIIKFCSEGWQRTILGDDDGRSVYNSIEPSPLYRLMEIGFDGIYLDRVDVYQETSKACPDGARKMVDFIARLGAHARKKNPYFMVILQNAEELLRHQKMVQTIDAVAKESLFYGWGGSVSGASAGNSRGSIELLNLAKTAGRAVFVVDYANTPDKARIARQKNLDNGFVPYAGPKNLDKLWLPGVNF